MLMTDLGDDSPMIYVGDNFEISVTGSSWEKKSHQHLEIVTILKSPTSLKPYLYPVWQLGPLKRIPLKGTLPARALTL